MNYGFGDSRLSHEGFHGNGYHHVGADAHTEMTMLHAEQKDHRSVLAKSKEEEFDRALEALAGSTLNLVVAWTFFLVSVALLVFALVWHKFSFFAMSFGVLGVGFLCCNIFAIIELISNHVFSRIHFGGGKKVKSEEERAAQRPRTGTDGQGSAYKKYAFLGIEFSAGSPAYKMILPLFYLFAFMTFVSGILTMPDTEHHTVHKGPSAAKALQTDIYSQHSSQLDPVAPPVHHYMTSAKLLLLLSVTCNLTAALNLACVIRDRFDAEKWYEHYQESAFDMIEVWVENMLDRSLEVLRLRTQFFGLAGIFSFVMICTAIANFDSGVVGLGTLSVGLAFLCATMWNLSKEFEDDDDDPTNNHTGVTIGLFLMAVAVTAYGIYESPGGTDHKLTLIGGMVSTVEAAFCISKSMHKITRLSWYFDGFDHPEM